MEKEIRKKAARTAVDAFAAVERIYRHANQVLIALKEEIKTGLALKAESPVYHQTQKASDPKSWIYHFIAMYVAKKKVSLDDYLGNPEPLLFIEASLYNPDSMEPQLRFGVLEKIFDVQGYKNIKIEDLFREVMTEIHSEKAESEIKALHCSAKVSFDSLCLLDVRSENDIIRISKEMIENHGSAFMK